MCQTRPLPDLHIPLPGRPLARRGFLFALIGTGGAALVGCVGPGDTGIGLRIVSADQIDTLGAETWERIRAETPASRDRSLQQAADRVGRDILRGIGENPRAWEIVVFQGAEVNAFALPGGKIGLYEGMFDYARDAPQLAAVIGHEIGHNQAGHAAERVNSAAAAGLGLQLVSAALGAGNIGYANEIAALFGAGVQYGLILPYGRNQELEADRFGVINMARGGYDPRASLALWDNMRAAGPRPVEFLSTHPAPDSRIRELEAMMPDALRAYRGA